MSGSDGRGQALLAAREQQLQELQGLLQEVQHELLQQAKAAATSNERCQAPPYPHCPR